MVDNYNIILLAKKYSETLVKKSVGEYWDYCWKSLKALRKKQETKDAMDKVNEMEGEEESARSQSLANLLAQFRLRS